MQLDKKNFYVAHNNKNGTDSSTDFHPNLDKLF